GRLMWLVTGSNGENLIRAKVATKDEAWRRVHGQAEPGGTAGSEQVRPLPAGLRWLRTPAPDPAGSRQQGPAPPHRTPSGSPRKAGASTNFHPSPWFQGPRMS